MKIKAVFLGSATFVGKVSACVVIIASFATDDLKTAAIGGGMLMLLTWLEQS